MTSYTPILNIQEVAPGQNDKETTTNNGFISLENATQAPFTVSFASNAATLSTLQYTNAILFQTGSQTANATLTVPLTKRVFVVDNSAGSYQVTVGAISGTTVIVPSSNITLIQNDGINCKSIIAGAATGVSYVVGATGVVLLADLVSGGVAPLASPALTGNPTAPTQSAGNNSTSIATTAYVDGTFAPKASPALTGTPTAPTATSGTNNTQIATTAFVSTAFGALIQGLSVKAPVRAYADTNVSVATPGSLVVDGVTLTTGDRLALSAQTTGTENGLYVFNGSGSALTRTTDASTSAQVAEGMFFWVMEGTGYHDVGFVQNTPNPVLGTNTLSFVLFNNGGISYTFSTGLTQTGTVITVDETVIAPLAAPAFTGHPTCPDAPTATDNSTKIANTEWVQAYVATLNYITAAGAPVTSVVSATGAITLSNLVSGGVAPLASPTFTGTVTMSGASNVYVPTVASSDNSTHAASTAFVQNFVSGVVQGLQIKPSARLATNASLTTNTYANGTAGVGATLTCNTNGALSIDGTATAVNDVVLVKNEGAPANNGLYIVTDTGGVSTPYILTRHTDMDQATEFYGGFLVVEFGTAWANSLWLCTVTSSSITVGTTGVNFSQLNGAASLSAGSGINITGTTISLASVANHTVMANISGGSTAPSASTLTNILDSELGSTDGMFAMRVSGSWVGSSSLIYSQLPSELLNVPLAVSFSGKPLDGQTIFISVAQAVTMPANFANSVAYTDVVPNGASVVFNVGYIRSGSYTAIGTVTFGSGSGTTGAFSVQGSVSLLAGDIIKITAPSPQDSFLSGVAITLLTTKV